MDYYLDITLLPDPEFEKQVLLNALFSKFHRGMSQTVPGEIGVSFPDFDKRLGVRLRLHGSAESLDKLMAAGWMPVVMGFTGYGSMFFLAILLGLLLYWRHWGNIRRLRAGTESKIGAKS